MGRRLYIYPPNAKKEPGCKKAYPLGFATMITGSNSSASSVPVQACLDLTVTLYASNKDLPDSVTSSASAKNQGRLKCPDNWMSIPKHRGVDFAGIQDSLTHLYSSLSRVFIGSFCMSLTSSLSGISLQGAEESSTGKRSTRRWILLLTEVD